MKCPNRAANHAPSLYSREQEYMRVALRHGHYVPCSSTALTGSRLYGIPLQWLTYTPDGSSPWSATAKPYTEIVGQKDAPNNVQDILLWSLT